MGFELQLSGSSISATPHKKCKTMVQLKRDWKKVEK